MRTLLSMRYLEARRALRRRTCTCTGRRVMARRRLLNSLREYVRCAADERALQHRLRGVLPNRLMRVRYWLSGGPVTESLLYRTHRQTYVFGDYAASAESTWRQTGAQ